MTQDKKVKNYFYLSIKVGDVIKGLQVSDLHRFWIITKVYPDGKNESIFVWPEKHIFTKAPDNETFTEGNEEMSDKYELMRAIWEYHD